MPPSTARVTVTLPVDLVERIDSIERNRSRFIAVAVEHEIEKRRREGLLRSIENPHQEAVGLAGEGLAAWGADLPEEEADLVDLSAGTPVRWEEGRGWIKGKR
jgi:post-segregation antitoxin (ccd killing protein)